MDRACQGQTDESTPTTSDSESSEVPSDHEEQMDGAQFYSEDVPMGVDVDMCLDETHEGSEVENEDDVSAQVVDVVVCALSLMSTNWVGCVREAWRVLKTRFVFGQFSHYCWTHN